MERTEDTAARLLIGVAALVEHNGKFLLVKPKLSRPAGLWSVPGGFLDSGETVVEGAKREAKEETGIDIDVESVLTVSHEHVGPHILVIVFRGKCVSGTITTPENEIEEAKWFTEEEIAKLEKEEMTHFAYNAFRAFKNKKQIFYTTDKMTP